MKKRITLRFILTFLLDLVVARLLWRAIVVGSLVYAIPQGGEITTGVGTITTPTPNTVQINQDSDKAIINWQSFNIGAGEKTQFIQPNVSSIALNRINPTQGASQIYGTLSANGRIILINQAGIYFGSTAYVDVAGIIASTTNITNENFLAGKYIFNQPSPFDGSIINEGTIIARNNGLVALIGTGISNSGYIQARLGNVVLASGNKFTMDFNGDQLISFTVDEPTTRAGVDQNGNRLKNGVNNTGKIIANGGVIQVTARAASGVLDNAINMGGIAVARSVSQHKGVIILSGGEEGTVRVSGRLNASSHRHQGGTIKVLGKKIIVESPAVINASGKTGGGEILIGGNAHGAGPEQNANQTYIASGATILANARLTGDGGKVVIWSNDNTRFYGNISVQGGTQSGNGGWVETSGKNYLDVNGGTVNPLALLGKTGTWLLDPTNIYIALNQANATAAGMTGSDTSANTSTGVNPKTFASSGAILDSLLTTSNLTAALNSANVIVTTTNDNGTGLGNINIVDPFSWTSANTLTLTAANNITINGAITTGAAGSALILNAVGNVTQTAAIGGSGGLTQQGAGTVTLNQANTYSGATAVNAGALTFDGSGSAVNSSGFTVNEGATLTLDNSLTNVTNRINGPLTLAGGEFVFKGSNVAATNASETMGILNLPSNYSTITVFSGTGGSTILTFASLNRSTGATILFRGIGQTNNLAPAAGRANIRFTTPPTVANTQLVGGGALNSTRAPIMPFAFGDTSTAGSGIGFVTYDNGANVTGMRNLITATEYAANTITSNANVRLTGTVAPGGNISINSLLLAGGTLNFANNNRIVTITSGAVGQTSGTGITSTTSTSRVLAFGTKEALIHAIGSFPIGSAITGTGGFTLSGPGTVTLNTQIKAITGGITINSGSLTSGFASVLASQAVTVNAGGTLNLAGFSDTITTLNLQSGSTAGATVATGAGTLTLGGNVNLNANGSGAIGAVISGNLALGATRIFTINDGTAANDLSISALISGATFGITKAGSGTLELSNANTYSGATNINAGSLKLSNIDALGTSNSLTVFSGANLDIAFNNGALTNSNSINLNGTGINSAGALTMTGNNVTFNNPLTLQSSSSIGGIGTGTLTLSGPITGTNSDLTINLINAGISLPTTTLTSSSNLDITTNGAITQTGVLTIPGAASFASGANVITLTQNNAFTGAVSLSNSGANDISVTNSIALNMGASNIGSGTLTLTGLGISQSGAIIQAAGAGNATINAGAGVINLSNNGNTFTGIVSLNNSGANDVQLTNSTALVLGASTVGSGTLGLTAGGTISETGAITQAANAGTVTLSVTTPLSDILLASQPNDFSGAVVYGGTLSNIRDLGRRNIHINAGITSTNIDLLTNLRNLTLILDNASVFAPSLTLHDGGNLYVDTSGSLSGGTGGNISQIGPAVVPGTVTLIAGSHAITANQNNTIGGAVSISNSGNNNVSITNTSELKLSSVNVGSGTLTLTGLGVSQTGAITQAASAGAATINAGVGPITLLNSSNHFTGSVSLLNSGLNNIALVNNDALVLGTSTIGTGTLSLTSGGAITQTGILTQSAFAGAITLASTAASSDFDFSTVANNLSGNISFGGTLANIQDFKLRNVNANAQLPTNFASLTNLRHLTLNFDNTGIAFPNITLHSGGNLSVTASGNITETGALIVPGTSSFIAGSHIITLTQNNNFSGAVALSNSGANNILITNTGALILDTSNVGSGTFIENSVGVSQIGIFTQANGAGSALFNAGAGAIALTQNNVFTGSIGLNNSGANNISLTNSGAIVLGTSNIGSGTFDVTAGGTISQIGPTTQEANAGISTYTFTVPNSDLLLNQANNTNGFINIGGTLSNLRDVDLRNIGTANQAVVNLQLLTNLRNLKIVLDNIGISLPALTLHSGGNLILDTSGALSGGTGGSISQTGVFTMPGTSSFSAGSHEISLTQNNLFTGNVTLSNSGANNVALTNAIALSLGTSSLGSGTLSLTGLGVSQTGAITQASSAGLATINAGNAAITLTNNNNFTGSVSLNNSGANNVSLNNLSPLNLAASSIGTGTLSITASGPVTESGPITQAPGAGTATFSVGANSISLSQANIFTGSVLFSNSGANNILLTNNAALNLGASTIGTGAFAVTAAGPITQSGIITQANNAGTASFNAGANAITLTLNNLFTGAVALNNSGANNIALINNRGLILGTSSVGTGTLSITANGALTQTGTFTQTAGAGAAIFNVGANAITLTNNNNFTGAVSLNNSGNNNVALTNVGLLTLGLTSVGSGTLNLTGAGVTQTNSISQAASVGLATINAGANLINLTNSGNTFTGAVSLYNSGANNIALTNNTLLNLNTSSVGTGTLDLTANGTISQSGVITQATGAGGITLTQNAVAADILFNTQPNNFSGAITFGGTLANIRDVGIRNINTSATLPTNLSSLSNLRNLTVSFDTVGLSLPAITTTGNLTITTDGSISQTGILSIAGTPTFTINAVQWDILLASAANNFSITPVITNSGFVRSLALRNVSATATVPTLPADLHDLTLIFDNNSMTLPATTLTGNLSLTANGTIDQSGALVVNSLDALTTLNAGSSNDILLTNPNNLFSTVLVNSANNVSLTNLQNLNLGASIISGNLTVNTTGAITQSGILNVTGQSTFAAGAANDITLTSNNLFSSAAIGSGKDVQLTNANGLDLGASTISGNLTLNTNGAVTQSGAIVMNGTNKAAIILPNSGDVTLTNINNDFSNLAIINGNNVSVTDANAINLAPASTILGNFTLNTSGAITQTGRLIVNGVGKITTLNSGDTNDITLADLTNDFSILTIQNARNVLLRDETNLVLDAITSHSLTATAKGDLTTTGLIQTSGGNVVLNTTDAGIITIGASGIKTSTDQISPGGSIGITAANTGSLPFSVYLNGELNAQGGAGGILTIGGGVVQNVAPVVGAGNITVTGNSSAFILNDNTYNTATVYNIIAQDIIINGLQQSVGVGSDLTFFAGSGNSGVGGVRVTTTGGIISSGNLTIKGSDLIINPGTSIELQAGSVIQAAGSISLLGNVGNSNFNLNRNIESTGINQPITLTPAGTGLIEAQGNITTNAGNINLNKDTLLLNNASWTTGGGAVTANAISGVGYSLAINVGNTTDLSLTNVNNNLGTMLITANNAALTSGGGIDLGASTISGNLDVTALNQITNSGVLQVTGTSTLTSTNNDITLTQPGNNFNRISIPYASDVSILDANAIDLGPINITGNLQVTSSGAVTQNGGAIVMSGTNQIATFDAGSANDIILNNSLNNFSTLTINLLSANNVTLRDINALNLGTISIAGNLDITTGGNLTQSGALVLSIP